MQYRFVSYPSYKMSNSKSIEETHGSIFTDTSNFLLSFRGSLIEMFVDYFPSIVIIKLLLYSAEKGLV